MYTSKLKIKTSSVNVWRSLCWWPGLSYCLVTSSILQGRPQKKPADRNCCDDSEARREDLGWQSEGVVWRQHWIQTGRGRRGTGVLGCADSWTPRRASGRAHLSWLKNVTDSQTSFDTGLHEASYAAQNLRSVGRWPRIMLHIQHGTTCYYWIFTITWVIAVGKWKPLSEIPLWKTTDVHMHGQRGVLSCR